MTPGERLHDSIHWIVRAGLLGLSAWALFTIHTTAQDIAELAGKIDIVDYRLQLMERRDRARREGG